MDNKVLDEAVEVACDELAAVGILVMKNEMRAALLAGVKVLLGEPVACMHPDTLAMLSSDTRAKHVKAERPSELNLLDGYVPLYAPEPGGGK